MGIFDNIAWKLKNSYRNAKASLASANDALGANVKGKDILKLFTFLSTIGSYAGATPSDINKKADEIFLANKGQNTLYNSATITVNVRAKNDSSSVKKYTAMLKDGDGNVLDSAFSSDGDPVIFKDVPTAVEEIPGIPLEFRLEQNYPNAFSSSTNIEFDVPKSSPIELEIYNILGQRIRTIVADQLEPGKYRTQWSGESDDGKPATAGIYFARLSNGKASQVIKMVKISDQNAPAQSQISQTGASELEGKTDGLVKTASGLYMLEIVTDHETTKPYVRGIAVTFGLEQDTTINMYLDRMRLLSFNFEDYFKASAVESVFVKTSADSGLAQPGRKFEAGLDEEHIIANGPRHLRSGLILPAGAADTTILHYLANADTSDLGLDTTYFRGLLTSVQNGGYRGSIEPPNDAYVAPTAESIEDTIFIYGPQFHGIRFTKVQQLNKIAEFFNDTARVATQNKREPDGLFGVDKQIIAIADDQFNNPDSIAQFMYANMRVVPQDVAPIDFETRTRYIIVLPSNGSGGNGTYFAPDSVTLKGGIIYLPRTATPNGTMNTVNEEAGSMLIGSVESDNDYPSLYESGRTGFYPQDIRRQQWIVYRGPGRKFPDLPKGFNPK